MRIVYLIAGVVLLIIQLSNGPRLPWIEAEAGGPIGLLRGFEHGPIGFSYQVTWFLIIGGIYQLLLGVIYWDMDTTEAKRWQFALQSGGTARLLWGSGAVTLALGILYAFFVYGNDAYLWPCGAASTAMALLGCWMFWLAFPLMEQVGIDREEVGV